MSLAVANGNQSRTNRETDATSMRAYMRACMRACERCTPWSGLTNRLSTSHERQKGFIPESPERANRLRKCSLRGRHPKAIRRGWWQWRPGGESEIFIPKPRRALPRHLDGITLAMLWALISYSRSPIAARIKGLDKPFRAASPIVHLLLFLVISFSRLIHPRNARGFTSGPENKSLLHLPLPLQNKSS